MLFDGPSLVNFDLIQHLRLAFQKATIRIDRPREDAMAKKQSAKKTEERDPFGELMTAEFVEKSFKEAVEEVWEENRRMGLDNYCTKDGKVVAVKPDGTVVPVTLNPKKTNG